ncbi:thioredoxin family protein [Mycoplasmopsis felis]|uniref:thioredoxin family protein n=1 Tax=Mycoplasmopsis felis TaxID=33923 RepID=UPI0021AE89F2|nr:thioredoxin family protein [Mycoplasmopsis felis]UWV79172.1 thioredoxin family protein [Mycoplasmopsis felis]
MFNQMLWKDAEEHINKKQKTQLTFLIFTTEWCGDCKMMLPTFNNIAKKYENQKIEFIQVDAEEAKLFRNPLTKWKVLKDSNYDVTIRWSNTRKSIWICSWGSAI